MNDTSPTRIHPLMGLRHWAYRAAFVVARYLVIKGRGTGAPSTPSTLGQREHHERSDPPAGVCLEEGQPPFGNKSENRSAHGNGRQDQD